MRKPSYNREKPLLNEEENSQDKLQIQEEDRPKVEEEDSNEMAAMDKEEEESAQSSKRSLMHRIFGPMKEGSLRAHIFIMSNVALGIAVLSLPVTLKTLGIIPGCLIFCLLGFITYKTLKVLSRVTRAARVYDLSELIKHHFGVGFQTAYDVITMIFLFGVLIGGQVVSSNLIGILVYDLFYSGSPDFSGMKDFLEGPNSFWNTFVTKLIVNYGVAYICLYPFCIPSDLSKIAWISVVAMLFLIYVIIVIPY